jgi:rubrerythrin
MKRVRLSLMLRRVALSSIAAPALAACAGTSLPSADVSSGSSDDDAGTCAIRPDAAIGVFVECGHNYPLAGSVEDCHPDSSGQLTVERCQSLCAGAPISCAAFVNPTAGPYVSCNYGPCAVGRRTEGLSDARFGALGAVARYLAEAAYLEAASIEAFDRMARELAAHGAPESLIAAARRSARDEARHARQMRKLAQRAGARVPACAVEPRAVRSLEAMAVENAVEGCVRETFGAVVGLHQAERANDPTLRRTLRRIARDETRHAELSWAVARWLDLQLDESARGRVRGARDGAIETLSREVATEPDRTLETELGLPSATQARAVVTELHRSLWSAAACESTLSRVIVGSVRRGQWLCTESIPVLSRDDPGQVKGRSRS